MVAVAITGLGMAVFTPGQALAAADGRSAFTLVLRPLEGAMLKLTAPKGTPKGKGWRLDLQGSRGLAHVDVADIGAQPRRLPGGSDASSPKAIIGSLFSAPEIWAWGLRAKTPGEALIRLVPDDAGKPNAADIVIEIRVVENVDDRALRLPLLLGEGVTLELLTNPATGAKWSPQETVATGLPLISLAPGRSYDPRDPTDWRLRDLVGAPQLQEWLIETKAEGQAQIVLDYGPPWDRKTRYGRIAIELTIAGDR